MHQYKSYLIFWFGKQTFDGQKNTLVEGKVLLFYAEVKLLTKQKMTIPPSPTTQQNTQKTITTSNYIPANRLPSEVKSKEKNHWVKHSLKVSQM